MWCLRDPTFCRFCRTPTCDGQTDGRTDTGPWLVPRMHSIARQKLSRLTYDATHNQLFQAYTCKPLLRKLTPTGSKIQHTVKTYAVKFTQTKYHTKVKIKAQKSLCTLYSTRDTKETF